MQKRISKRNVEKRFPDAYDAWFFPTEPEVEPENGVFSVDRDGVLWMEPDTPQEAWFWDSTVLKWRQEGEEDEEQFEEGLLRAHVRSVLRP